jgi:hypothetical protein
MSTPPPQQPPPPSPPPQQPPPPPPPQKTPHHVILCAGLSCLDLQLVGCTQSGHAEAIETYDQAIYCAGGSASMTATALALMMMDRDNTRSVGVVDEEETSTTTSTTPTPVHRDIHVVTKVGHDPNGDMLLEFYRKAGAKTDLCLRCSENDATGGTSMAVLPIFQKGGGGGGGGRGCYFNLGANRTLSHYELLGQLDKLQPQLFDCTQADNKNNTARMVVDAFLFGYPHLLPLLQGDNLKSLLTSVRTKFENNNKEKSILIGVDLNGVNAKNHTNAILGPALHQIDILHLNQDEAEIIFAAAAATATQPEGGTTIPSGGSKDEELLLLSASRTKEQLLLLQQVANQLHYPRPNGDDTAKKVVVHGNNTSNSEEEEEEEGCAVVLLSMGSKGSFISVTSNTQRLQRCPSSIRNYWKPGTNLFCPAYAIDSKTSNTSTTSTSTTTEEENNNNDSKVEVFINTNGAGDALFAGFCWIVATQETVTVEQAGRFASLVARQRCDTRTRNVPSHTLHDLWTMVQTGTNLPPILS